jgi:uncharacterized membrane protein
MAFAGFPVPPAHAFLGWLLLVALLVHAGLPLLQTSARRDFLPQPIQQHAWLAGIVALGVLWSLPVRGGAVEIAMIGVSLYALLFGYARALLGAAVALIGLNFFAGGAWAGVGLQGLVAIALPAALAAGLQRLIAARLPRHLFVFILGNGLFVTLMASGCAQVATVGLQIALAPGAVPNGGELIGYALLLAWGEALASGMIFSALVIFRPQIVMTYAQDDYLPPRGRL